MKRFLACLLLLCCLPLTGAFGAAGKQGDTGLEKLYTGRTVVDARVFADWKGTEGVDAIGVIPKKTRVAIHALNPTFALVTYEAGGITGYIRRVTLEDTKPVDNTTTPPYGVDFNHFIGAVAAQDAPVTDQPGAGETLITLHEGARVSIIGFENGYAKLIYHRQYGYIDSRLLGELSQVYEDPEAAGTDAPIASYTSFYKITTDESNLNRMVNLGVACQRLAMYPLHTGDNLDFNRDVGPYRASSGYLRAGTLTEAGLTQGYGGGTCQVSSTLYNVLLQLPGITVLQRRAHGANGASYLPIGVDAAVGNKALNLRFRNDYPFPIRIDGTVQDGALTIAIYRME